MRLPTSLVDEIRRSVRLTDVVGPFVVWDQRKSRSVGGRDLWACCPFHTEKSASFHADDEKGRYHCFGCGASGDIFTFLMEKQGLSFPQAIEALAQKAGIPLPKSMDELHARDQEQGRLFQVLEISAQYFRDQLYGDRGFSARAYLQKRGLSGAVVKDFHLGYAPDSRHALQQHLSERGVTAQEMRDAGMVVVDPSGDFDRFRDRIMFPIHDSRGKVIAFGGRAMSSSVAAKYLNSPQTAIFQKKRSLYCGPQAYSAVREAGNLVIVEGYTDVMALYQAGVRHVFAPLGTALTREQLSKLWGMVDEPILCFDGDSAGIQAAYRVVGMALGLLEPGKSLRFVVLHGGCDPDELVRREGRAGLDRVLELAVPLVDMLWQRETATCDLSTPERRAAFQKRMETFAGSIEDPVVRKLYTQELRQRVRSLWWSSPASRGGGANMRVVADSGAGKAAGKPRMARDRHGIGPYPVQGVGSHLTHNALLHGVPSFPAREAILVATVLHHPLVLQDYWENLATLELTHDDLSRLRDAIMDRVACEDFGEGQDLVKIFGESDFRDLILRISEIMKRDRIYFALPGAVPETVRKGFLHTWALHRKLSILDRELSAAREAFEQDGSLEKFKILVALKEELGSAEGMESAFDDDNV